MSMPLPKNLNEPVINKNNGKIFAGIVAYFPDKTKISKLISSLSNQVDEVLVYDNGGASAIIDEIKSDNNKVVLLGAGENNGIGSALNRIAEYSTARDASYIWTFDQDSLPSQDLLHKLLHELYNTDNHNEIAAISPIFIDKRGNEECMPIFQIQSIWIKKVYPPKNSNPVPTSILITSGMLIAAPALKVIGGFREDFFIDHVDTEWCLRAIRKGYRLYSCPRAVLDHELSDEKPKRVMGRLLLKYSPLRRYYSFRNSMYLATTKGTPFSLRLYYLLTLIYRIVILTITDEKRWKSFSAMSVGIMHGALGKLGKVSLK